MDFVKKHYEKILLAVVLLGLVGALVFLPFLISRDQEELQQISQGVLHPSVKRLPDLDLSRQSNVAARLSSPYVLDFSTTNKVFNPLQWMRKQDGILIPAKPGLVGPDATVVTKISALYLVLTLDSLDTNSVATNAQSARFVISVEHQAAAVPAQRARRQHYASAGEKVDVFKILDVKGSLEDPAQLQLNVQLMDTGERVTLTKDKPFRRVDGYTADLKYDPDGKKWPGQRVGSVLVFAGDGYKIVAINQDSVILSAQSNQKKTTLRYAP